MKAKYTGPHRDNWYGLNLVTGESYDVPPSLEAKVKSSKEWKTSPAKKAVKKRASKK